MADDFPIKYMAIVPTYFEIFKSPATFKNLIQIIKQIPVFIWLNFLSRIQSTIAGNRIQDIKNQYNILHGIFSEKLQKVILAFEKNRKGKVYLCYERQVSALQQLVILYAPDEAPCNFDSQEDREKLCSALLMVHELINPDINSSNKNDIIATVITRQIRMSQIPLWKYAARAFKFYDLQEITPNQHVKEYLDLFQQAESVNVHDFFFGGLDYLIQEDTRDTKELSDGWNAVTSSAQCINPVQKRITGAFEKCRCGNIENILSSIKRIEIESNIRNWNLISLSQYPLIRLPSGNQFVLSLTSLAKSLFDGVRHVILTAALDGRLPNSVNKKFVGGLYGKVFQHYVQYILETAFPNRVIQISEDNNPGNADFLIFFPGKILIVEVKSEHFVAKRHFCSMSIDERRSEIETAGITKAVKQIQKTINALWNFMLNGINLPDIDWTITQIIPLIVTEEEFPIVPECWDLLYKEIAEPITSLNRGSGLVGRLRILSLNDIELIPDLKNNIDFGTLLFQWGADSKKFEYPFKNYLDSCNYQFQSNDFMISNFKSASKLLGKQFGLDVI